MKRFMEKHLNSMEKRLPQNIEFCNSPLLHTLPARLRDARDAKGTQRRKGRRGRRAVTPKNTSGMSFALIIAILSKQLGKAHPLVCSPKSLLRCGGNARDARDTETTHEIQHV